jgi:competence protein ComEA
MNKLLSSLVLSIAMSIPAYAAVNLNSATQAELEAVKGIGPAKAKAIIAYREKHSGFRSVDDLAKVKGFGEKRAARLKGEFEVSGEVVKGKK